MKRRFGAKPKLALLPSGRIEEGLTLEATYAHDARRFFVFSSGFGQGLGPAASIFRARWMPDGERALRSTAVRSAPSFSPFHCCFVFLYISPDKGD